ncbi:hypothetical protein ES703_15918 [subsurface metagenome]
MTRRRIPRLKTEQLVALILYRYDGSRRKVHSNPTVRDIQEELTCLSGRRPSTAHIRHLILNLERKGVIERVFHYRQDARQGSQAQATEYIVKGLDRVFNLALSVKQSETMTEAREKDRSIKGGLPGSIFPKGYHPNRAYVEGYLPYYRAIVKADLGPKFPKGDSKNLDRVKNANNVLIEQKTRQRAARVPFLLKHPLHK